MWEGSASCVSCSCWCRCAPAAACDELHVVGMHCLFSERNSEPPCTCRLTLSSLLLLLAARCMLMSPSCTFATPQQGRVRRQAWRPRWLVVVQRQMQLQAARAARWCLCATETFELQSCSQVCVCVVVLVELGRGAILGVCFCVGVRMWGASGLLGGRTCLQPVPLVNCAISAPQPADECLLLPVLLCVLPVSPLVCFPACLFPLRYCPPLANHQANSNPTLYNITSAPIQLARSALHKSCLTAALTWPK